jgi:hypothetical protein
VVAVGRSGEGSDALGGQHRGLRPTGITLTSCSGLPYCTIQDVEDGSAPEDEIDVAEIQ